MQIFARHSFAPSPPIHNTRVMVTVWMSRENIIRTSLCWIVWHNVHSRQHTYVSSSYRSNRLGLSHWNPTLCVQAVALSCIVVTWWSGSWGIQAWSRRPAGFLQCFDTVVLVIWPVKIVPEMTYNVLSGTLRLYTTTHSNATRGWLVRRTHHKGSDTQSAGGCSWIECCR